MSTTLALHLGLPSLLLMAGPPSWGEPNEESGYDADGLMIFGLPPNTYYHYDRLTPETNGGPREGQW